MKNIPNQAPLSFGSGQVPAGSKRRVEIPIGRLPTQSELSLPVVVLHGAKPGPSLWLSGAIHGDELNGVEIIREVQQKIDPAKLAGTVYAVPIVNVFGFLYRSRYLPDRRDLNRSFPGSRKGSMASRLAHVFMTEIVSRCQYGIDLHTAATGHTNLPQIRANLDDLETRRCARAFGAPVMLATKMRDGSLREAAAKRGIHTLLYEAGEPLKFHNESIRLGVRGILNVMATLGMIEPSLRLAVPPPALEFKSSKWVRARDSGILRLGASLGQSVQKGEILGNIYDAFGETALVVKAPIDGVIIGAATSPMINEGEAIVHIAYAQAKTHTVRHDRTKRHQPQLTTV